MVRSKAVVFFRKQKRMLRRRQLAMHKAREEWHHNAELLAHVEPSPARDELVAMLKQAQTNFYVSRCSIANSWISGGLVK